MKKVTLIFGFTLCLILSAVVVLNAGWWVYTVTEPASSSCSTPSYGDELNEGFLGTGYENTWAESGSSATIDEDTSLSGSPPTACCNEGLAITLSGTGTSNTYWDRGSTISYSTSTDIVFWIYFTTLNFSDDYEATNLVEWNSATTHYDVSNCTGWVDVMKTNTGTYVMRGRGSTSSSNISITTETWYKVKLHLDSVASDSYLQIDDGTQYFFTRKDVDGRYLSIGTNALETGDELAYQIGYIYVDTP